MKEHHLSVVTLEEYEPNREFVGRNFNAGEVIQLVLKSARPPHRWLPFRYVQMVMMHELAHCEQMNHSRAFWAVRNAYAAEMTALWGRGYTGEGIWGRGARVGDGEPWSGNTVAEGEPLPEHLCGGTYRSRGRRGRKRKPKLSWKEQKERRIAKKFGVNGTALGADEGEKVKLEGGKKVAGKPRVARSMRGRELRAAAALARFDKQKVEDDLSEELPLKREAKEEGRILGSDEETASDSSDFEEVEDGKDALDLDGSRLKDKDGRALVKVCEDEDADDPSARNELDELRDVFRQPEPAVKRERDRDAAAAAAVSAAPRIKGEPESSGSSSADAPRNMPTAPAARPTAGRELRLHDIPHIRDARPAPPSTGSTRTIKSGERPAITIHRLPTSTSTATKLTTLPSSSTADAKRTIPKPSETDTAAPAPQHQSSRTGKCPLCSLENGLAALSCAACANVLRPEAVKGSWRCGSASCKDTGYINAGDCGVCGLCGGRRP